MEAIISIPRLKYQSLKSHLFQGETEQGAFLFATSQETRYQVDIVIDEIYLITNDGWDSQSALYLELSSREKVKVMLRARDKNCDLIECHSHRTDDNARFSYSDIQGLNEFIGYVKWKLPGKSYAALVWSEKNIYGQLWLPKSNIPMPVTKIRILNENGSYETIEELEK